MQARIKNPLMAFPDALQALYALDKATEKAESEVLKRV